MAGSAEGLVMRQRHGIGGGELVLLSVGRLEFNKGFDLLAEALGQSAQRSPVLSAVGWRWIVVGGGPFRAAIDEAVRRHGIANRVIFTGRVPDGDLHAWYEAASLFVHPTRYEGSSLVTLEAMAHRRAIVATRAGGLPDKVKPGVNGWLVEPGSADALTEAVLDAAGQTAKLAQMGQESRRIVEQHFAWPRLAAQHIELYEQLLKRV